jgi:acetyl-CoA carboxylase biotin carboxylase subunit
MFHKVLIANRGEIAVRVLRASHELGLSVVSVFSDADWRALHVRLADEALWIGAAPAEESYLKVDKLLEAAHRTGAEAIHPGYGFLSENAEFAQAVQDAGLVWIGPPAEVIAAMGDKAAARKRMQAAGVPVVPGYQGPDDLTAMRSAAEMIGYPLLVKPAAGGGGKGMRVVTLPGDLEEAIAAARRESLHAFGDQRLILERFIPTARHIEFQILADSHGKTLHVFERECSVQRRYQKIIEETPSPLLDGRLREQMGAAAVAAAQACGYQNAGTVEFIVDPDTRQFYFLEMNTRLQVEHPVTELVTGLDLVKWQIRIAAGEALPYQQTELSQRGHAIECRLYAEDPANHFLPAAGPLLTFHQPSGPGVRFDAGFTSGDEISTHYDPLIAKLITYGEDRRAAIFKMETALRHTVLLGVSNNIHFLQDVLAHADFQGGKVHTTWVETTFAAWQAPQCDLPADVLVAAALSQWQAGEKTAPTPENDPYSPWRLGNSFRQGGRSDLSDDLPL